MTGAANLREWSAHVGALDAHHARGALAAIATEGK